jgi:hypothetical protein
MLVFIFSNMRLLEKCASRFEAEEVDVADIFPATQAEPAPAHAPADNDSPGAGTSAGSN